MMGVRRRHAHSYYLVMASTPLWAAVLISLVSGLAGALLTVVVLARREHRRSRVETLKRFAANRYDVTGDDFTRVINETFVAFNDSPPVMAALAEFHRAAVGNAGEQTIQDRLVALFKTMCASSGVRLHAFNDSFFLTPFNTRPAAARPAHKLPAA